MSISSNIFPELTVRELTISSDEYHKLVFEETLLLVNLQEEIMDEVTIAVEDPGGLFMVYQYGQSKERTLRIQSSVLSSLQTRSEVRRILRPSSNKSIMMTITGEESFYHVFTRRQESDECWREKMEVETSTSDPVLFEGANTVLLRKIAINQLSGQLKIRTVNHDMDLCECVYDIDPQSGNGEVTVRRTLRDSQGTEVTMVTVLTTDGRIVSQRWSDSEWYLKRCGSEITEAESMTEEEREKVMAPGEPLKADQAAYFRRKEEVSQKLDQYLLDHTDVQDLIADLLKNVLFEEPEDVVDFADNFFSEFLGTARSRGHDTDIQEDEK